MYFSAFVDKGFSGRGFINLPATGWVERTDGLRTSATLLGFINLPATGVQWAILDSNQ